MGKKSRQVGTFVKDVEAIMNLRLVYGTMPFGKSMDDAVPLITATVPPAAARLGEPLRAMHTELLGFQDLPGGGSANPLLALLAEPASPHWRAVRDPAGEVKARYYGPSHPGLAPASGLFESGPVRDPRWSALVDRHRWVGLVVLPRHSTAVTELLADMIDGHGAVAKVSVTTC